MAEEGLIENGMSELQQAMRHIHNGDNFLLSGGAGSGKTYSLVEVISEVLKIKPFSRIACITYTNAAVKEIQGRISHKNLSVSTIHDFIWDNIRHFQKELKSAIIELANNQDVKEFMISDGEIVSEDYFDNREEQVTIQYKEYLKLREGIISHDELLLVAEYLFRNHRKLCDILKDKYRYIFIDEYQDTHKEVVKILLDHLPKSNKKCVVGFFGDAMQSIYDTRVGDINHYAEEGKVKVVVKKQNRRNPRKVIELANSLRLDGLRQEPSSDIKAPNMTTDGEVKEGSILFLYSQDVDGVSKAREILSNYYNWNFENAKETKELNLTHRLIAGKAGFKTLIDIYNDPLIDHARKIREYVEDNHLVANYPILTFGQAYDNLETIIKPSLTLNNFITKEPQTYNYARSINFDAFSNIYIDKDQLLGDKKKDDYGDNEKGYRRDNLIRHLFRIQKCVELYKNKQYNEFLRMTDYRDKIRSVEDKRTLKLNIESLINVGEKTIREVIEEAHNYGICVKDDRFENFVSEKEYVYRRVSQVKFSELQNVYDYVEGKTPFSTQHNTKGLEFDNVFVILDNGRWRNYDFASLFTGQGNENVRNRTRKIFYVCCTRAKENLAVYYYAPSSDVLIKAKEWFGENNVKDVNEFCGELFTFAP